MDHTGITFEAPEITIGLDFRDITRIAIKRRIAYKGLQFLHTRGDLPATLVFWTFSSGSVLEAFEAFSPGLAIRR